MKDAISNNKETSQVLATAQEHLEELQEECLSEKASEKRGTLNSKSQKYRHREIELRGTDDDLDPVEEDDLEEEAVKYEDQPPCVPSTLPMAFNAGDTAQLDMQVYKLELEVKLQKLTNELQELKSASSSGKCNNSKICQSLLERAVNLVDREGQDISEVLAFPVIETVGQQGNTVRQYQMLEFKVTKEVKTAVS